MLFGHGDDIAACSRSIVGNFSSNVWFDDYTREILPLINNAMSKISCYPEPDARSLREQIALSHNIGYNNVLVSNGAIEAIYLTAQTWKNRRSLIIVPTFSEYEDACHLHHHLLSFMDEEDFDGTIPTSVDMVWLCNPNNPTGKVRSRLQLLTMVEQNPDVLFFIDQSYGSFYSKDLLHHTDVLQHSNLIILCSLTKCFAIPGIRVGYAVSAAPNIDSMLQVKIPWSVNTLAIEVAKYFVANSHRYPLPLTRWMELKHELCKALTPIHWIEIRPSETPFFLIKLHEGSSSSLKSYLINDHGLLIRDASNFRSLDNTYVRIAPQHESLNRRLVNAIQQWKPTK